MLVPEEHLTHLTNFGREADAKQAVYFKTPWGVRYFQQVPLPLRKLAME